MKPISLVIDGVNSFYDRQEIDFRFDGLFCICGDTGSGKTTILDCIIIALFGSGNRALLNDYINLRRDKAEIRFVFEAESDGARSTFEVVRLLSRTGATKARLVCLTTGETVAEQTNAVNAKLKEIVGLTMEDFTQMVILEQGRFAKFLTAGKKDRNETVGNLFKLHRYKDLGSKFSVQMKEIKRDIDNLDERLGELKDVTAAAVDENERLIKSTKKQSELLAADEKRLAEQIALAEEIKRRYDKCVEAEKRLAAEQADIATHEADLAKANAQYEQAEQMLNKATQEKAELAVMAARRAELDKLTTELNRRLEAIELLSQQWKSARADEARYQKEHASLVEKEQKCRVDFEEKRRAVFEIAHFGENAENCDSFDIKFKAERLVSEYKNATADYEAFDIKYGELSGRVLADTANVLAANRHSKLAFDRRELAKRELADCRAAYEKMQREEATAFVLSSVKEGDVCPICGQTVEHKAHVEISVFDPTVLQSKEQALSDADKEYMEAENNKYSFSTRLEESQKALSEVEAERIKASERVKKALESIIVPDKIDTLVPLATEVCELGKTLTGLQSEIMVVCQKTEAASAKAEDIKQRGTAERAEANRLQAAVDEGQKDCPEDKATLDKRLNELSAEVDRLTKSRSMLAMQRDTLSAGVAASKMAIKLLSEDAKDKPEFDEAAAQKSIDEHAKIKTERERLIASAASMEATLEVMRANLDRKRGFERTRADKRKRYDILADIYKLVSGDKFIEYVAEEYILQFTSAASAVLSDITGGKYTLEYKAGTYYINDFLSGGMERKASTLSGGETFLASLSLAIAISREIARYKTYEFFFLDEGFGTLDARSIDMAINALTTLASDTLVGVVTHRSELTDRIFDKINVLAPEAGRGSRVVRSD